MLNKEIIFFLALIATSATAESVDLSDSQYASPAISAQGPHCVKYIHHGDSTAVIIDGKTRIALRLKATRMDKGISHPAIQSDNILWFGFFLDHRDVRRGGWGAYSVQLFSQPAPPICDIGKTYWTANKRSQFIKTGCWVNISEVNSTSVMLQRDNKLATNSDAYICAFGNANVWYHDTKGGNWDNWTLIN